MRWFKRDDDCIMDTSDKRYKDLQMKEVNREAAYTYKDLLCKSDNFILYDYTRVYYTGRSRPGDMGRREYESYKESSKEINTLNKAIDYCIHVRFAKGRLVIEFNIAHRCDSVENLKAYSECLKDAVKFAKEASRIIHEQNPYFEIC